MNEWHFYLLFDCVAQLLAVISFFESHVSSNMRDFGIECFGLEENNIPF